MDDMIIEYNSIRQEYWTIRRNGQRTKTTLADFHELNEKRKANGLSPVGIPPEITSGHSEEGSRQAEAAETSALPQLRSK